jgi:DNA-binding NarL/FixJ family response regulator
VAAELKRRRTGTRVVIVTTFARPGYLRRALEAGASGYLLKDMRAEELADAVRRVHQGLRVIHPELATEAWGELRGKVWPAETLPGNSDYPTERCAIISPKRSANWERAIECKRRAWPEPKAGCRSDLIRAWQIPR